MLNEHPGDDLGINPGPSMRTVSFLALAAAGANTPQKEFTHCGATGPLRVFVGESVVCLCGRGALGEGM